MEETLTAHNFWRLYDSGILWKFVIEHEGSWDSKDIQQLQAKISKQGLTPIDWEMVEIALGDFKLRFDTEYDAF